MIVEPPPKLPDSWDVSHRYKNNPRFEQIKNSFLGFAKLISGWQYQLDSGKFEKNKPEFPLDKDGRAHKGLLIAITNPVGGHIWHADPMGTEIVIPEAEKIIVPLQGPGESLDKYKDRLKTELYDPLLKYEIQFLDGASVAGIDGTILETRMYLHAQNHNRNILPDECSTRHRVALSQSYLNEYPWLLALGEEENIVRSFSGGTMRELYDPRDNLDSEAD